MRFLKSFLGLVVRLNAPGVVMALCFFAAEKLRPYRTWCWVQAGYLKSQKLGLLREDQANLPTAIQRRLDAGDSEVRLTSEMKQTDYFSRGRPTHPADARLHDELVAMRKGLCKWLR